MQGGIKEAEEDKRKDKRGKPLHPLIEINK